MKTHFFQMEVKQVAQEDGAVVIEGFASTPDVDRYKDIVEPKAFESALKMYMKNPVLLYQHDADKPVGNVTSATVTDKGLSIVAEVKDEDTKQKVKDGRMRAFSIGYIPLSTELQNEDGTAFDPMKQNVWDDSLIRVIKNLDLVEISIVTTPANGNALFSVAKSVKSYFNEVVYKSMNTIKKNVSKDEQDQAVTPPKETPATEDKDEQEAPAPKDESEATEATEETAAEGKSTEPTNGQKPQEDDEKGDENAPADSAEGGEEPTEEAKAESKPDAAEEGKSLVVSKEFATSLPLLAKSGLVVEAKDGQKAAVISKEATGLMQKMHSVLEAQDAEIKRLTGLLEKTPQKSALVTHGQFQEGGAEAKAAKEPSPGFMAMFQR